MERSNSSDLSENKGDQPAEIQPEPDRHLHPELFNFAPACLFATDREGKILDLNISGAGLLQREHSKLKGRNLSDYLSERSGEQFRLFLEEVYRFEGKKNCEAICIMPDGAEIQVRIEGIAFRDSGRCHLVMYDVSEQKRTEELLRNNENLFGTLFDLAVDAILLGSPEGIIINANKSAVRLTGFSLNEMIGFSIDVLFAAPELERVPWEYKALRAGKTIRRERNLKRKDGSLVAVEMITSMMPDGSYQSFIRDISTRKTMEDALRASEKKFFTAFMTSPDSININRMNDGVYIDVNQGFCKITGYTREDVIGNSSTSAGLGLWINQSDRDYLVEQLSQKGEVIGFEAPFRMKDGTIRYGSMSARFIDLNGEQCILSTTRDITERKIALEALSQSEQSYRGIIDTVSESIYILNFDGRFIDVNAGAVRMYGYNREEFIGQSFEFVSAPGKNDLKMIYRLVNETILTGETRQFEFCGLRKNGEVFSKEVICNKGIYFNQDVIIITARDITERKRTEEVLITALKKAEESERLKTAFLANMSHEIRSPMNSIVGFSELLEEEDLLPEQRKEFVGIIRNSGKQLLTIINDIIDFAKIESNHLTISPSLINLNQMLESIMLSLEIEKKNLHKETIDLIFDEQLPDDESNITTDEVRLKQILLNLTGNALKFTSKGFIKIGYRIEGEWMYFFVQDTGKGIAPDKQHIIFERFRQEEESYTRLYGGTGLGLSISKGLVELLGGKMWLESEPGFGSTFYFTLPISVWSGNKKPESSEPAPVSSYDFTGKTIIVAEDIPSNFRLIKHMLSRTHAKVLHAGDGKEAVELCQTEPNIDLILMDIQMPVMDGLEATRAILKFKPGLPVIALTAFSFAEDIKSCMQSGCVDYLTKPIEKSGMLEKVKKYLHI